MATYGHGYANIREESQILETIEVPGLEQALDAACILYDRNAGALRKAKTPALRFQRERDLELAQEAVDSLSRVVFYLGRMAAEREGRA